ncbi:hypothetical protein P7K49_035756, partial [Saguinus oedipus]
AEARFPQDQTGQGKQLLFSSRPVLGETEREVKEVPKDPLPKGETQQRLSNGGGVALRLGRCLFTDKWAQRIPTKGQCPAPAVEPDTCVDGRARLGRVIWWASSPSGQTDTSKPAWLVTRSHCLCAGGQGGPLRGPGDRFLNIRVIPSTWLEELWGL